MNLTYVYLIHKLKIHLTVINKRRSKALITIEYFEHEILKTRNFKFRYLLRIYVITFGFRIRELERIRPVDKERMMHIGKSCSEQQHTNRNIYQQQT